MTITVSLNGLRATSVRWTIPAWGASYADVTIDQEETLSGAVTLVVSDLTLHGTIISGGPASGQSFYRVVAGAGGWGRTLKKRAYSNDAGVKLVTVLQDAANECGETLDTTTVDASVRLGPYFVRPADLACRVLEQLAPNAWYVGEDGKTRLGARPSSTLPTKTSVVSQVDLARATATLASDTIAAILPGLAFNGLTVVDVEHEASAEDGLRSKVWGRVGNGTSRRLAAFRALVDQIDPLRKFRGIYEYRVVTQSGERLNLQPVRVSFGMPDVQGVQMRPGVPGCKGTPALGSRVLVRFVDCDPTNPVVVGFENSEAPGFLPTTLSIGGDSTSTVELGPSTTSIAVGGGSIPVARQGDPVTCVFPPALPIVYSVSGAPPMAGVVTIANPISGSISGPCSPVLTTK